jgi:N-acetylglucosamine kinase-like BadF-type ATPase
MLAIDLGQSGSRVRYEENTLSLDRGKLSGEALAKTLEAIFQLLPKLKVDVVSLSLTGFNGLVTDPDIYGALCNKYFGATKTAVIDDGFAGFVGALNGRNGVVLSIGGGVVSVGGREGKFAHRDGLGSTFGDEGGGFWLGKLAITKALGIRQGRGDDQEMLDYFADECAAFDALEVKNNAEAATLAIRTAKKVLDAADAGVSTATAIVDEGAYLLAQTVVATWYGCGGTKADSPEIVIQGGPARNATYATKIALEINAKLPNSVVVKSTGDNLDGATWIANNLRQDAPPLLLWSGL